MECKLPLIIIRSEAFSLWKHQSSPLCSLGQLQRQPESILIEPDFQQSKQRPIHANILKLFQRAYNRPQVRLPPRRVNPRQHIRHPVI